MPIQMNYINAANTAAALDVAYNDAIIEPPKKDFKKLREFLKQSGDLRWFDTYITSAIITYDKNRPWRPGIPGNNLFSISCSAIDIVKIDLADSLLGKMLKEIE